MSVMYYASVHTEVSEQLQKLVESTAARGTVKIHRTITNLAHRLSQPAAEVPIVVLLAAGKKDLMDIISIRTLLMDCRIIIILPDREDDTISKGHSLRPRFLSFIDSDFTELGAVLSKMLQAYEHT
jgi:6-phosphogluconate dehydrogenase